MLLKRDNPDAPTTAKVRVLLFELVGDRFQFRVRVLYRHVRFQPCDNLRSMRRAFPQGQTLDRNLKGNPNFSPTGKIESRRQHSHDVVAATMLLEGLSK